MLWSKQKGHRIPSTVPIIEGPSSLSSDHTLKELEVDIDGEQWVVADRKHGKSEWLSLSTVN